MENIDLFTYCILEDIKENKKNEKEFKNQICRLDSDYFKEWKKIYKKDFEESYLSVNEQPLDVSRYYFDPDGAYKSINRNDFFEHLVLFLKKSESEFSDKNKLLGKFEYELVLNEGIKVTGTDEFGKSIRSFYLRSDQFGFSAPSNIKAHPYDLYISKSDNKEEAVIQVIDWISKTRTIGGSFLWPMPFYKKYNLHRGGKVNSSRKYYIQDRVDLTLQEISNWYKNAGEFDILRKDNIEGSNLNIWLNHFNDFPTYISFFCFGDFVDVKQDCIIKSIIPNKTVLPQIDKNGKKPKLEIVEDISFDNIKKILERLSNNIVGRSVKILNRINK